MDQHYKPRGYSSVSAYIVADEAQNVINFVMKAFDAVETRRYDMPDGTIMHAEIKIDDTIIMIGDSGNENPAFPIWLHVYVPDVDATYQKALNAGGISVDKPTRKKDDPDRRAGIKDPAGNTWWIATQIE